MEQTFDTELLLDRWHVLPRGPRVRLRLAQTRDAREIARLLDSEGVELGELERARLVRYDPRRRVSICATALLNGRETVVGVGTIVYGEQDPELVCVDRTLTDGLDDLVERALRRRARFAPRYAA